MTNSVLGVWIMRAFREADHYQLNVKYLPAPKSDKRDVINARTNYQHQRPKCKGALLYLKNQSKGALLYLKNQSQHTQSALRAFVIWKGGCSGAPLYPQPQQR